MAATTNLDGYLTGFRKRLRELYCLRAAAVIAVILLGGGALGGYLAMASGFAAGTVITARILLFSALAAAGYFLLYRPLGRLQGECAGLVEQRVPEFAGRVRTFLGLADESNPFRPLLAEDALTIADRHPVAAQFRERERRVPLIVAALSALVLLWLIFAGPGLMKYGVRHLLAGWLIPDLLPPQTIAVTPGDEAVRRGGSLRVAAEMEGFLPEEAAVHARIGDGEWQEVPMAGAAGKFEFTFFSIREPIAYYVEAAGIRSPAFNISVVDLPEIESLRLVYHFPEWTRREPEEHLTGGDISTVADTEVELELTTDAPLDQAELVLNGETIELAMSERTGVARFKVDKDGQYYLGARVGREQVRLSDDYFIRIVEDGAPAVSLARPGRDWSASNIEEVTLRIDAADDYNLEALSLHYSVNGGDWQRIDLQAAGRKQSVDQVMHLEDFRVPIEAGSADGTAAQLAPGDLISYYAEARDRLQTARTDMFFIDVQDFDRRYFQSQQAGGGGGGQGQSQQEISSRQREIIVSTWNLIREQAAAPKGEAAEALEDNATLLSELQRTLAEQAKTLADRTRARELSEADEQIASFVEHLDLATEAMGPASERLAELALEDAILPEQEALRHLLRAESTFNDVNVSFQRNRGGGGGGGRAGGDLAEMFELEMDLEKNQYETGSNATPEAASQAQDEAMRKLEELARRQQQLADNLRNRQVQGPEERWRQELLRREAEELQREIENMQQQMQAQGGESGGQGGAGGDSQGADSAQSEIARRLQSAIRAMNEAAQNMEQGGDPEELQRAADEARRQLQGAREGLSESRQAALQDSFRNMREQADRLYQRQARVDEELQEAVRRALTERERSEERGLVSGLDPDQEIELADTKVALSEDLQTLQREMQAAARDYARDAPEAVRELETATRNLREAEVDTRLSIASEYIRLGAAAYIAGSESAVTGTLRGLRETLERAETLASGDLEPAQSQVARTLDQARTLRGDLQRLREDPNGAAVGQREGGPNGDWREPLQRGLREAARGIWSSVPELQERGISPGVLDDIRRIASLLDTSSFSRNDRILDREYNSVLTLLEQLEYQLREGGGLDRPAGVRNTAPEPVPGEYRNAVAEYYRELSRRDAAKKQE